MSRSRRRARRSRRRSRRSARRSSRHARRSSRRSARHARRSVRHARRSSGGRSRHSRSSSGGGHRSSHRGGGGGGRVRNVIKKVGQVITAPYKAFAGSTAENVPITGGKFSKKKAGNLAFNVATGAIPETKIAKLGKAGKAAGLLGKAKKAGKGKNLAKEGLQALRDAKHFRKGEAALKALGKQPTSREETIRLGKDILKKNKGVKNFLIKNKWKMGLGAATGFMGISTMATWASADNIAGQASMSMNQIASSAAFNDISKDEIDQAYEQAKAGVDFAETEIKKNVMFNPLLFFAGKVFKKVAESARNSIDQSYDLALKALDSRKAREERQNLNDQRNQDFQNQQDQRDQEFQRQQDERNQFFENLRQQGLSEEEILRRWNAGRSSLGFGLLR